jgi:hypothetical protein
MSGEPIESTVPVSDYGVASQRTEARHVPKELQSREPVGDRHYGVRGRDVDHGRRCQFFLGLAGVINDEVFARLAAISSASTPQCGDGSTCFSVSYSSSSAGSS